MRVIRFNACTRVILYYDNIYIPIYLLLSCSFVLLSSAFCSFDNTLTLTHTRTAGNVIIIIIIIIIMLHSLHTSRRTFSETCVLYLFIYLFNFRYFVDVINFCLSGDYNLLLFLARLPRARNDE